MGNPFKTAPLIKTAEDIIQIKIKVVKDAVAISEKFLKFKV